MGYRDTGATAGIKGAGAGAEDGRRNSLNREYAGAGHRA